MIRPNGLKKKGFNSKGVAAEEFYKTIDPESFKSFEEVEEFVAKHSYYIQLIKEEKEYSLECVLFNNPLRFFMNEEGIFQIGEYVYKVIEHGSISTSIQNIDKLKNINENNFGEFRNDPDVSISKSIQYILKSVSSTCADGGSNTSDPVTNGSKTYRTKLSIYPSSFDGHDGESRAGIVYRVACQVRTLGIWWSHETTLYANVQAEMIYSVENEGTTTAEQGTSDQSQSLESYSERYINAWVTSNHYGYDSDPYLTKYTGSAQTDAGVGANNAGIAELNCGY